MTVKDWMVSGAVAAGTALIAWGGMHATIGDLKEDVQQIKLWKDDAIEDMAGMDTKLDMLLAAQGLQPPPKPKRRNR